MEPTPTPTPTSVFQFDAPTVVADEDCAAVSITVRRLNVSDTRASVDIASSDGTAKQKGDYTLVVGRLVFEPGEAQKSFPVLISEDGYAEGIEHATLLLQNPQNGALGADSNATLEILDEPSEQNSNPIDETRTFVCQHYHDFLYRQGDPAGEEFWTQGIEGCGPDAGCREVKRVDVSTAFFLSIEFQTTGYLVIRAHKAAFGNAEEAPRYRDFLRDQRQISEGVVVGQGDWRQRLEQNRRRYLEEFVSHPDYVARFEQGGPAPAYVNKLFRNVGAAPTQEERQAAEAAYGSGDAAGRAAALESVIESGTAFNRLYNDAFVLMQYFGYLRRDPDAGPDSDFSGYRFWLGKMNSFSAAGEDMRDERQALERVRRAEMVRAFIESFEYRQRFHGAPAGNQEGTVQGGAEPVVSRLANAGGAWRRELARAAPFLLDPLFTRLWLPN